MTARVTKDMYIFKDMLDHDLYNETHQNQHKTSDMLKPLQVSDLFQVRDLTEYARHEWISLVVDSIDVDAVILSIEYSTPHRTGGWHASRIITVIKWPINRGGAVLRESQNPSRIEMVDELGSIRTVSICQPPEEKKRTHIKSLHPTISSPRAAN